MKFTTDVWFAAFLIHKGNKVANYDVLERGKVRCYFDLTDKEWQKFKLEFHNSELSSFKTTIDKLKDLGY